MKKEQFEFTMNKAKASISAILLDSNEMHPDAMIDLWMTFVQFMYDSPQVSGYWRDVEFRKMMLEFSYMLMDLQKYNKKDSLAKLDGREMFGYRFIDEVYDGKDWQYKAMLKVTEAWTAIDHEEKDTINLIFETITHWQKKAFNAWVPEVIPQ